MNRLGDLKKEIRDLLAVGENMYQSLLKFYSSRDVRDLTYFTEKYESWYTKSLLIIKQVIPDRTNDFITKYSLEKRKTLDHTTYTISDALNLTQNKGKGLSPANAAMSLYGQVRMLESCNDLFDSKIKDIQNILQADIFDSEIESSKHLLKNGFFRASGAICGVILEKHLAEVCKNRNISVKKKSPTIADFNDELKDNAYDLVEWRKIQHLADIRNLCDHNKDREPTKEEVEELINGTDRVIKTIF